MIFIPPSVVLISMAYTGFLLEQDTAKYWYLFLTTFLLGFLFPIVFFVFLMKKKRVSDVDARIKEERTIPYLFGIFLLVLGLFTFKILAINEYPVALWRSFLIGNILILLINKLWKISAHALGTAIAAGAFIALNINYFIPVLIVVLVGISRIRLKCHAPGQVIAGAILGFSISFINVYLISYA